MRSTVTRALPNACLVAPLVPLVAPPFRIARICSAVHTYWHRPFLQHGPAAAGYTHGSPDHSAGRLRALGWGRLATRSSGEGGVLRLTTPLRERGLTTYGRFAPSGLTGRTAAAPATFASWAAWATARAMSSPTAAGFCLCARGRPLSTPRPSASIILFVHLGSRRVYR